MTFKIINYYLDLRWGPQGFPERRVDPEPHAHFNIVFKKIGHIAAEWYCAVEKSPFERGIHLRLTQRKHGPVFAIIKKGYSLWSRRHTAATSVAPNPRWPKMTSVATRRGRRLKTPRSRRGEKYGVWRCWNPNIRHDLAQGGPTPPPKGWSKFPQSRRFFGEWAPESCRGLCNRQVVRAAGAPMTWLISEFKLNT